MEFISNSHHYVSRAPNVAAIGNHHLMSSFWLIHGQCWLRSYEVKLQMAALYCLGSLGHILVFSLNVSGETAAHL